MRAAVDLDLLGARTLWVDCDVLQADGGTRTAAITGASVAVALALQKFLEAGTLKKNPLKQLVAAVSTGVFQDEPIVDLCYLEDKDASVDFNVVMTEKGEFVEVQGSGEETTFSAAQMASMLELARIGIARVIDLQRAAIGGAGAPATTNPPPNALGQPGPVAEKTLALTAGPGGGDRAAG